MCNEESKKRHLTTVNACPVCKCQVETMIHALRECSVMKKLWQELGADTMIANFFATFEIRDW